MATIFLNRTSGKYKNALFCLCVCFIACVAMVTVGRAALPILWEFLRLYPTPERARAGDQMEMATLLAPLGLHKKRAGIIARMSGDLVDGVN